MCGRGVFYFPARRPNSVDQTASYEWCKTPPARLNNGRTHRRRFVVKRCSWRKQKKSVKEFRKHGPKAAKKHGKYYRICKACSKEHGEVNRKRYKMLADGYGWCIKCHQWKAISEFHKSIHNPTGITTQCVRCTSDNTDRLDRQLSRAEMFGKGLTLEYQLGTR